MIIARDILTQSTAAYSGSPSTTAAGQYVLVQFKTKRKQTNYTSVTEAQQ